MVLLSVATVAGAADLSFADTNAFYNRQVAHLPDAATDDWATPAELVVRGGGDCEDFAIAKYFALLTQGVPPDRLRLVYGRLRIGGGDVWRPHVALVVLPEADAPDAAAAVLDSVLDEVRPLSRRPDLQVLVSFNAQGLWPGLARGPAARPPEQLRRWARVLAQARGAPGSVAVARLREPQVQVELGAGVEAHRVAAVGVAQVRGHVVGAGGQ